MHTGSLGSHASRDEEGGEEAEGQEAEEGSVC